ncbi:MAG TPA: hypothetical protein PKN22_08045, partial [Taishania sp.]|nr:hypothetical protein [Taishania sp.]
MEEVISSKNKLWTLEQIMSSIDDLDTEENITCVIFTHMIPFQIKRKRNRHFVFCNGKNLEKIMGLESIFPFVIIENMKAFTEDASHAIKDFLLAPNNL